VYVDDKTGDIFIDTIWSIKMLFFSILMNQVNIKKSF
jgi:hypothetical protein